MLFFIDVIKNSFTTLFSKVFGTFFSVIPDGNTYKKPFDELDVGKRPDFPTRLFFTISWNPKIISIICRKFPEFWDIVRIAFWI